MRRGAKEGALSEPIGVLDFTHDLIRQGMLKEADELCDKLLQLVPGESDVLMTKGIIALKSGARPSAIDWLLKALEANTGNASVLNLLMSEVAATLRAAWDDLGANVRTERLCRRILAIKEDAALAHLYLGGALSFQGHHEAAEPSFRRAIALVPGLADAHLRLARVLFLQDRPEEARRHIEEALATAPEAAQSKRALADAKLAEEVVRKRRRVARWPNAIADFADLEGAIRKHLGREFAGVPPILGKATRVLTHGSCFAGNLAASLRRLGVDARNFAFGEVINSTYANRAFVDWVSGTAEPQAAAALGATYGAETVGLRQMYEEAKLVVFTLGVAPCFFDKATGKFFLNSGEDINAAALLRDNEFRTTTVAENVDNILAIIAKIRAINPEIAFVFTVSPVPLAASFEYASAVMADCVSKSTLRVAIDEVMRKAIPGVHYWPSFEIVRWMGAYHPGMYGAEDGSSQHVSTAVVDTIMRVFIDILGDDTLKTKAA
jgi:tetratricopeptide (TPR) repeat protein